jgi:NAD(P)-dependent dehydrogenase (short-subunit alcohol dehydrogenase family)
MKDFVMKKIFISGIKGAIGTSIAKYFSDQQWVVYGYSRDGYLKWVGLTDQMFQKADPEEAHDVFVHVNAIGGGGSHQSWPDTSLDKWKESFENNVIVPMSLAQKSIDKMRINGFGRIINIASVAGTKPLHVGPEYAAAKSAMIVATISLAKHLKGTGITANCISPGLVSTTKVKEMMQNLNGSDFLTDGDFEAFVDKNVFPSLTGSLTTPNQLAELIDFLQSNVALNITGQNLVIDGGYTLI